MAGLPRGHALRRRRLSRGGLRDLGRGGPDCRPIAPARAPAAGYRRRVVALTDHFLCAGYGAAQALFGALRETKGDAANKERLIQIITDMKIDSPRGALRFDPKNHNPISDIHMRTVQANPLRHVVTDVLNDVRHPDSGACVL